MSTEKLSSSNLEHCKKAAKTLVKIWRSGEPGEVRWEGDKVVVPPEMIRQLRARHQKMTEKELETADFTLSDAQFLIARSRGFESWSKFAKYLTEAEPEDRSPTFDNAINALEKGDFSRLESMLGGPAGFDTQIMAWHEEGLFKNEPEALAEAFACACMLGHPRSAAYFLDHGVDPYAGMKTGLSGFHYAASSGRLDVIKLLIERGVPMEVKNMYGGTVFGQAIWSAINEYTSYHAEIVERLVRAGAIVDDGYLEWWEKQAVPDADTKRRIAEVLRMHYEFHQRVDGAEKNVVEAEAGGAKQAMADALKELGNILRRPPLTRAAANAAYERAASLYLELGQPLEAAWVKRHIGINHEYANKLEEAERHYDESLSLFREHAPEDDPNYANTVRYPAVIKQRLGKREESARLWEEAHDRYAAVGPDGLGEGVAEAAAWLTIFAIEADDRKLADKWFERASEASAASNDADTHKFIADVQKRIEEKFNG